MAPFRTMIPLTDAPGDDHHDDIIYPAPLPFVLVHVVYVAAIWTGVTSPDARHLRRSVRRAHVRGPGRVS